MHTTQREKKHALANASISAEHVTFVGVDFKTQSWFDALCDAGFDPSLPTLFTWEGVTYYLTDENIDFTMRCIACCPLARIVYDVFYDWFSFCAVNRVQMDEMGEPLLSGVKDGREAASAQAAGCLLYTSPSPRDQRGSRMPSSA